MSKLYSLGVMTGTSCDGADGAVLEIENTSPIRERLIRTASRPFPKLLRKRLREAQTGRLSTAVTAELCRDYSEWMAGFCKSVFQRAHKPVSQSVIALHGQTIWHQPPMGRKAGYSVQLVDPAVVSAKTGITVTAGFRQPDLARGGHGAPLVPYYHWLRASSTPYRELLPFAIHNVGGIANLTILSRKRDDTLAFDTGPGNSLIDMAMESLSHGRKQFDQNGAIARQNSRFIRWDRLERLGRHPYFHAPPPKSTGRELFDERFLSKIPGKGAARVANATAFTAHTMACAYRDFVFRKGKSVSIVFVAGGGAKNPFLLTLFSRELARLTKREILVAPLPDDFAPPQYLEAMAFARFGFEALCLRPVSLTAITGAKENGFGVPIYPGENFKALVKSARLFR